MMASIPNMRSTPLPVPAPKGSGTEAAPGDFAAQMPPVRGQPEPPVPPGAEELEFILPGIGEAVLSGSEQGDSPEAGVEAPEASEPARAAQTPAIVIPLVPIPPSGPGPQQLPTVAADEAPDTGTQIEAPVDRHACGLGGGKAALPLPTVATQKGADETQSKARQPEVKPAERAQTPAPQLEAAVKELLQRKQISAKSEGPAPKDAGTAKAKPEIATAPAQAQPQTPSPATPQPAPAIAAQPTLDALQPMLATTPAQPEPLKADAPRTVEGTRTADVAAERQLDLARDGQWLDRLARDIARAGATDTPLRFRLNPQTLGHLQVELQQGDHGTAVRLTVETEAARQLLADAQPRLAAEARAQGVRIAETHVDLSGSGRHAPGDQRRQEEARHNPMIRTAPGAGEDAVASARASSRAGLDRYA